MASERDPARWLLVALVALACAPALLAAGHALQEYDPAQYAEVGRRILVTGRWGHLEDAFGPFLNKPPLTFWLIAMSLRLFGVSSFAARLPSLLAGAGLLAGTWRLGSRLWDRRTGTVAACFTASSVAFQLMVADPKVDLILTACICWAIVCLVEARSRPGWMWGAWIFAALGFLTKGPVGVAIPAFAVLPEALRRPWSADGAAGGGWAARLKPFHPLAGPTLAAAVVVPWFVVQFDEWGWGGLKHHFWDQSVGRFLESSVWHNDAGPLFFVHTGLWAFLPFSAVLVFELIRASIALGRMRRLAPDPGRVCVWWFALTFVVISGSSYKLPQYLFPILPAAALISARGLMRLGDGEPGPALRWLERGAWGVGGLLIIGVGLLGTACFPLSRPALIAWFAALLTALLLGVVSRKALAPGARAAVAIVLPLVAFDFFFQAHLHPALLAYQPDERVGALARATDPTGRVLPFLGADPTQGAGFYAQRDVRAVDASGLRALLLDGQAQVAVLSPAASRELVAQGWKVDALAELNSFPTSRPTRAFLAASTRDQVLDHLVFARVAAPR